MRTPTPCGRSYRQPAGNQHSASHMTTEEICHDYPVLASYPGLGTRLILFQPCSPEWKQERSKALHRLWLEPGHRQVPTTGRGWALESLTTTHLQPYMVSGVVVNTPGLTQAQDKKVSCLNQDPAVSCQTPIPKLLWSECFC